MAKRSENAAKSKSVVANKSKSCLDQQRSEQLLRLAADRPIAHYSKGLSHDPTTGEVNADQYQHFIDTLIALNANPEFAALNGMQFRTAGNGSLRNFVNPQSGWSMDPQMTDPGCYSIALPPGLDTEEAASEIIELYWMSALLDIPFAQWDDNPLIATASRELSGLKLYVNAGNPIGDPNTGGDGVPSTAQYQRLSLNSKSVFRGGELARYGNPSAGISESVGPYVSQFLLHDAGFGTQSISQRNIYAAAGINYMTSWPEWLRVQNGERRNANQNLIGRTDVSQRRYISTMRDLATYVHFDQLFQPYLTAALILLGAGYPVNPGNPYGPGCSMMGNGQDQNRVQQKHYMESCNLSAPKYPDQDGFASFGGPQILSAVTEVATRALKAVWRTKWTILRLRPEMHGALVHRSIIAGVPSPYTGFSQPIMRLLQSSQGIDEAIKSTFGNVNRHADHGTTALLPMAFPEGSPTHPSYGAGHATVAGACVTVLKALFNSSVQFIGPVEASADGKQLLPYRGMDAHSGRLTVELELNKLASNVSIGRNMGGVHYRSDYTQSMLLGQQVAVDMLYRQSADYSEDYFFKFHSFGGKAIEIRKGCVHYDGKNICLPELSRGGQPDINDCQIAEKLSQII